jgi:hypothetical protein
MSSPSPAVNKLRGKVNASRVTELDDVGSNVPTVKYSLNNLELKQLQKVMKHVSDSGEEVAGPNLYKTNAKRGKVMEFINDSKVFDVDPETENEMIGKILGGKGEYADDDDGMYSDEIQELLKERTKRIIPVIASNEIPSLYPLVDETTKHFAFVMNMDPSTKAGSHWIAVHISRPEASIEYYDSLVNQPSKRFLKDIKPLIERMRDNVYYKLKVNMVKDQSDSSANCGYFAINFIDKRLNGKRWDEASFFNEIDKSKQKEKEIEKYKTYL